MNLDTRTVTELDVYSMPYDLRRDIHAFVHYISEREVKRAYRSNALPKADSKRLAKLMSHPDCLQQIEESHDNSSWWIDMIDSSARILGFVSYDTEGEYMGYSSHSPSFRDNYIVYNEKIYKAFLAMPLLEQEKRLFLLFRDDTTHNELFHSHWQSKLDHFPHRGMATGAVPLMDFGKSRRTLFRLLANLDSGKWYTTASLIRHLKGTDPFFLIPPKSKLPQKDSWGRPTNMTRYGNFHEYKTDHYDRDKKAIPDDAPDGFERVEGRFIERFLEGIPLTLGYVDVAYSRREYKGMRPERGTLLAFRINGRFQQLMHDEAIPPTVTILPTFEIHVESPFYPISLLYLLWQFAIPITEDKVNILKLDKQRVKTALANHNNNVDLIPFLQQLSSHPIPQNVKIELEEWIGQADAFTLYTDFALLEGDSRLPETKPFVVEQITPKLRIVRQPSKVFDALEQAERAPLAVRHMDKQLMPLPPKARSIFPKAKPIKAKPKRKTKQRITLSRETRFVLHIPTDGFYEQLRAALLKQRCIFEPNQAKRTITYGQTAKPLVEAAIKEMRQTHIIKFEDKPT